ncbi:MAG TPA: 5'/3'-nucleotidase SurE, partial [Bacteroidetes bacterium]|nr:5'/3'-nucleotidase SurE [Bacteroidota bacterium]
MAERILLTNDDGYLSPGLQALYEALSGEAKVTVVAPDRERSAVAMGITLTDPLRVWPIRDDGLRGYFINGTPADCVKIGCSELMDEPPDYVFSGINRGSNVGLNCVYSGTVAGALEGALLSIPSVAVSLASFQSNDYRGAVKVALHVLRRLREVPLEHFEFLSVNVPPLPVEELKGIRVTRVGYTVFREVFDRRHDARDREYYWMGGKWTELGDLEEGDDRAVGRGYAAVTP